MRRTASAMRLPVGHGRAALLALAALVVGDGLACSSKTDEGPAPLALKEGCNPLAADADCMLPFPSDFFLIADPSMPSGRRISFPAAAVLRTKEGTPVDLTAVHRADGAANLPQILALFPGGVDAKDLVFHDRAKATLEKTSTTLLLDAVTGEPVLHFAELDPNAETDDRRALILRPLVRLKNATRYVVAIRGLKDRTGAKVPTPEGFRRLRDARTQNDPVLGPLSARYDRDVFPVLERFGVARADLLLAWDFTTRTEDDATHDMLAVRAQVIAALEKAPPKVTITDVVDNPDLHTRRLIHGTMTVPLFVDGTGIGARLVRDAKGQVVAKGTAEVPFSVHVPPSAVTGAPGDPAPRAFQYGHGFFGEREELYGSWSVVPTVADRNRMVGFAVDWWGMMHKDDDVISEAITRNDMSSMLVFTDRVHQGMANQIALAYAMKGTLKDQDALKIDGRLVYDPTRVYWYGISQGSILGGAYVALSPHVERAVLCVGGGGFSMMMMRSKSFEPFLAFIRVLMPDPLDVEKLVSMTQLTMDRIEAITYAPHLLRDGYPGGPKERRVLQQYGLYDSLVPNLATETHARSAGLSLLSPSPRGVALLPEVAGPFDGSALVQFDLKVTAAQQDGVDQVIPAKENPVHDGVRKTDAAMKQIDAFLRPDGKAQTFCDGPCDPG